MISNDRLYYVYSQYTDYIRYSKEIYNILFINGTDYLLQINRIE